MKQIPVFLLAVAVIIGGCAEAEDPSIGNKMSKIDVKIADKTLTSPIMPWHFYNCGSNFKKEVSDTVPIGNDKYLLIYKFKCGDREMKFSGGAYAGQPCCATLYDHGKLLLAYGGNPEGLNELQRAELFIPILPGEFNCLTQIRQEVDCCNSILAGATPAAGCHARLGDREALGQAVSAAGSIISACIQQYNLVNELEGCRGGMIRATEEPKGYYIAPGPA